MDVDMDMDMDMPTDSAPPAAAGPPPNTSSAGGSPGSTGKASEPRRRNRPALSCIQCRTRKIRCDRNEPCASCMKSKIVNCTYEEARRPKPRLWRISPAPAAGRPEPSPNATDERLALGAAPAFGDRPAPLCSNSAAAPPSRTMESLSTLSPGSLPQTHHADSGSGAGGPLASTAALAERVRQLEQQLSDALKRPAYTSPSSRFSHAALPPDHDTRSRSPGAGSVINGDKLFPLAVGVAKRIESDTGSDVYSRLQKCRQLARSILSARTPLFVLPQLGKDIPPQATALRLVEAYFRTFESAYRILHRPTFWHRYNSFWENADAADPAFVVQLQLCMAIGTCFQDDVVSLRHSALRWVYEAQVWLASPTFRSRVSLAVLQVMCLLHLARETCGVEGDLGWIGAGCLLRTAMSLGLHRDPDNLPSISAFAAEMRRRLWATVLEIILQSSLDSGAPPLIGLSDFDTRPPSNYDDDQLAENAKLPSIPRPPNAFTQSTVQLALLRSFPVRLAIAQYVNHFSSPASFEETLRWNTELTNACRALSATFQPFYDPAGILPKRLSLFQLRLAEHMVHRFFLALNHPWLWSAHSNPTYYFARKMCVETSLKLYRAIAAGTPAGASGTASQSDDFTRLATCGYGAFRSVPTLAVLTICLELLWQVQEDRSFRQSLSFDHPLDRSGGGSDPDVNGSVGMGIGSGAAPQQELLEAVRYSIGWAERRIRCGETNVKGLVLFSALLCQVQSLQRGASDAEVERLMLNSVAEELKHCLLLLDDAAGRESSLAAARGAADGRVPVGREGLGSPGTWDANETTRGFNSVFNIHDADFFIGT